MAKVTFELMTLECASPKTTSVLNGLIEEMCRIANQLATIRRILLENLIAAHLAKKSIYRGSRRILTGRGPKKLNLNSVALVRKRTIQTEPLPLVGEGHQAIVTLPVLEGVCSGFLSLIRVAK
jgi:hypothetical protein